MNQSCEHPKRILLKISGECCCPVDGRGIAMNSVLELARQLGDIAQNGIQLAVVMGGGNILRGSQFKAGNGAIREATAHEMGMLATVLNGLAIRDALESIGHGARLLTAIEMNAVAEPYTRRAAREHLENGRVVLLAGGTGSPFVTTDTAAAQRALELDASRLLKATKVDGVYSDDPVNNPQAVFYDRMTYDEFQAKKLRVLDQECVAKCSQHDMPILVFNYRTGGNLLRASSGEHVGTWIGP